MRDFCTYYLRWRVRALTYVALLTDRYPPFGDADYPSSVTVAEPSGERERLSVGLRLLLVIPHIIALFFLLLAWLIVTVFAWFTILFTGKYPASLLPFAISVLRYITRVEAYLLLLVDEYPPFTLD